MNAVKRPAVIGLLMLMAAAIAFIFTPRHFTSSVSRSGRQLESIVPKAFGEWRMDENASVQVIDPQSSKKLEVLYTDTLTRTYVHKNGAHIMLSLAYGSNQSRDLQIHKPEVCYVSQGFQIGALTKVDILGRGQSIPVMRITAQLGKRVEPITYWIRSGDDLVRGWYEQNKSRISAGLRGNINDGLLFRVSSISADETAAYRVQEVFIKDMLAAIDQSHRHMFLGSRSNF